MPRAKTKEELLISAQEEYKKLFNLIESIDVKDRKENFKFDVTKEKEAHWKRDKNIKDILIHLYEWHQLLLNWIDNNTKGIEKQFLLEGYNWKTYGDMSLEFFKKHQNTSYEEAIKIVEYSHNKVMKLLEKFNDKELFTKDSFKWVGGSTLGSYFISTTASHYVWAIKKVKKHKESFNK